MDTYRVTLAVDIEADSHDEAIADAGRLTVRDGDDGDHIGSDLVSIEDPDWNEL